MQSLLGYGNGIFCKLADHADGYVGSKLYILRIQKGKIGKYLLSLGGETQILLCLYGMILHFITLPVYQSKHIVCAVDICLGNILTDQLLYIGIAHRNHILFLFNPVSGVVKIHGHNLSVHTGNNGIVCTLFFQSLQLLILIGQIQLIGSILLFDGPFGHLRLMLIQAIAVLYIIVSGLPVGIPGRILRRLFRQIALHIIVEHLAHALIFLQVLLQSFDGFLMGLGEILNRFFLFLDIFVHTLRIGDNQFRTGLHLFPRIRSVIVKGHPLVGSILLNVGKYASGIHLIIVQISSLNDIGSRLGTDRLLQYNTLGIKVII